jgi:2,4-dienoyl-CoA reductase-like NADH-dependent reductase (Old Yellow Enzyme family)
MNVILKSSHDGPRKRKRMVRKMIPTMLTTTGASLWAQLSHPGRQSPRSVTPQPVAPSDVPAVNPGIPAFAKPRALTKDDIQDIIQRFARTSAIVKKAGFQGVQIHGTLLEIFY